MKASANDWLLTNIEGTVLIEARDLKAGDTILAIELIDYSSRTGKVPEVVDYQVLQVRGTSVQLRKALRAPHWKKNIDLSKKVVVKRQS